jgi:asparagine synthase (glutamine-hydrolysing)
MGLRSRCVFLRRFSWYDDGHGSQLMFRYVGLVWNVSDPSSEDSATRWIRRLMQASPGWRCVLNAPGVQVFCRTGPVNTALTAHPLAHGAGVVLGTVFHRLQASDSTDIAGDPTFTDKDTDRIVEAHGRVLLESYWGRYVAFITSANQRTTWVVKDPTGRLPCFTTQSAGVTVVFSYMPDCVTLGVLPFHINWNYIAARIALGCGRPDDTGIENVSELCGGECLELREGRTSRHLYWDLGGLFTREIIEDPVRIARSLRATAQACTHTWARKHDVVVHQLSGGLDSSIVLACLAQASSRPRIVCLTYYRQGGVSGELSWARLAAQHSGCEHVEYARSPHIDFAALSGMRASASPPLTHSFLETDRLERNISRQYQATAICSGDGGDSLFGSTSARFSVLDYARRRGVRPALLRLASDVALLGNQSVWTVLSKSVRYALFNEDSKDTIHLRDARKLACSQIREPLLAIRSSLAHPWFRSGRLPPGASEILSFLTLPDLFYPPLFNPDDGGVERVFPLLSQPLVQLCVSIPSYLHFDEGRDRGLARRAFARDVPEPILNRTWKDRVQGFPEEILRASLPYFRELLLDGVLVKERYLDRKAVEITLSGQMVKDTASVGEILDHVIVEAWLRSWINGESTRTAA